MQQKVITSDNPGIEPKCHNLIMNEMPSGFHIQADRQKSLEHSVPPYPSIKLANGNKNVLPIRSFFFFFFPLCNISEPLLDSRTNNVILPLII